MELTESSLVRQAFEKGRDYRDSYKIRVSPFYKERVSIRGKIIDITPMLDAFFFAGYDGEPYPTKPDALDPDAN